MAWLLGTVKSDGDITNIPVSYFISTYATSPYTNPSIKIEKSSTATSQNSSDILYAEKCNTSEIDYGDITIEYGLSNVHRWTVRVKSGRIIKYNNTEYVGPCILFQWAYYETNNYTIINTQKFAYNRTGYSYNIVTKSTSSSAAIITVKYYNKGNLISSTDITHYDVTSTPYNIGNLSIYYSSSEYKWVVKIKEANSIVEFNGAYYTYTSSDAFLSKWSYTTTVDYKYYDCN